MTWGRITSMGIATALLLAVACGGGDDAGTATTASPAPTTAGVTTSQDTSPPEGVDRSAELVGRWEVTDYAPPTGGLTNVVGDELVFIEFRADGVVGYGTGCNHGGTTYETSGVYMERDPFDATSEGQPIDLGPLFEQEQEGCEGFLGDQDVDLPAAMDAATRFILDGNDMSMLDEFLLIRATRIG